MTFIRPFQRTLTALFPHQANRRYLIPSRPNTEVVPVGNPVITTTTLAQTFDGAVFSAKPANLDGHDVTVNAVPVTVTDLTFPDDFTILLTWSPAGLITQTVIWDYDGVIGLLREQLSLLPLASFQSTGAIP